jgi:hypothetical protein
VAYSLKVFETAPPLIQSAAAQTVRWKQFYDRGHALPPTADAVAQMFLGYLVYSGGTVAHFDWLVRHHLFEIHDYEMFLDSHDDLVRLRMISAT